MDQKNHSFQMSLRTGRFRRSKSLGEASDMESHPERSVGIFKKRLLRLATSLHEVALLAKTPSRSAGLAMRAKVALLTFALIALTWPCYAGTYTLNSGRAVTGEITEQTDEYIKVDTGESVFKIKLSMLDFETLDRLENGEDNSGEAAFGEEVDAFGEGERAGNEMSWHGWLMTSTYYLDQMNRSMSELEKLNASFHIQSAKLYKKKNRKKYVAMAQRYQRDVETLMKNFKKIDPPPEFRTLHFKILEYQKYNRMIPKSILLNDRHSSVKYYQRALKCLIGILEEQKILFTRHGAPEDYLKGINRRIKYTKKMLASKNYRKKNK